MRGNVVDAQSLLVERRIAGILLIMCGVVFAVGGILYTERAIWKWPAAQTGSHLIWERGWVVAAALINVLGFVLLESLLGNAGDAIMARPALTVYVIGTAVLVAAEGSFLNHQEWVYPQVVLYVVLALLAQAAFGVALLRTGLVPAWAGWATIVWNLGWLAAFTVIRPHDIYYPALHHVAPLIIGIALLASR
jgi:hypothetical protein